MPRWQGITFFALFTLAQTIRTADALPASPTQYTTQGSTYMGAAAVTVKVEMHGSAAMPSFGSLPIDLPKVLPFRNSTELSGQVEPGGADHVPGTGGLIDTQLSGETMQANVGACAEDTKFGSAQAAVTKILTKTEILESTMTTTTTITVPGQSASAVTTTTSSVPTTTLTPIQTPSPYTQTFKKTKSSQSSQPTKSSQAVTSWTQVFQSTTQPQASSSNTSSTTHGGSSTGTTKSAATKSTATQQATGTGKLTQWDQGVLDRHNSFREKYKAPPLTWDASLATTAMQWAQKCDWKHDPALGSLKQGQNMDSAASSNGKAGLTPEAVLEHWVTAEVADYDPNNPQASHFTQVVWKGTSRVGCASVSCNLSMYDPSWWPASFVVCNYASPGNVAGQYAANVSV